MIKNFKLKIKHSRNKKSLFSKLLLIVVIFLLLKALPKVIPAIKTPLIIPTITFSPQDQTLYQVVRVIDGDTIVISSNGAELKVRFIGIDTPELYDPRKTVQCFAKEASLKTHEILDWKQVFLEQDLTQQNTDKYGRLLRYIFLPDKTNVNKLLVSEGYAHEYTYQSNPYTYRDQFIEAQNQAREKKRGLWADGACQ